jgi:pyruvate formate lyase activating enzyme
VVTAKRRAARTRESKLYSCGRAGYHHEVDSFVPEGRDSAIVFDIQRFSLHDGPGIRTTVFLKGCPLFCAWCQNPESHRANPEIAFYQERCARCFACRGACPAGAIFDEPGRRVDYPRCTGCGACARVCPHDALRLIGSSWEAGDLARELERDRDCFDDSRGGVTLSGGEPMGHPGFALTLAKKLSASGIRLCVETAGAFAWESIEPILPFIQFIYFDLKLMDPRRHLEWIGADNRRILENFALLSARFEGLQARMPVIPGVNDDEANLRELAAFLRGLGRTSIHCLPYHALGESKLARIDSSHNPLRIEGDLGDSMRIVKETLAKEGIDAIVYD